MTRTTSDEGLRLVKSFEGYHRALNDGSDRCTTYRCQAGKLSIGYGCTEGITEGMVWTREEAEAALRRELVQFEAGVNRLVTVDITQNEFDAMVSLAYNIGLGGRDRNGDEVPGFSTSTLLRRLNAGDRVGAAEAFKMWDKYTDPTTKQILVSNGLVSRREREAALFLKPGAAPEAPYMPHAAVETVPMPEWVKLARGLLVGSSSATAILTFAEQILAGVNAAASGVADFVVFAVANPVPAAAVAAGILLAAWPKIRGRLA